MDSHTERINRLLALWLDLQQAVAGSGESPATPWNSQDQTVCGIWRQITHPQNRRALEEWLFQIAPGPLESWAQQALLECRRRADTHSAGADRPL